MMGANRTDYLIDILQRVATPLPAETVWSSPLLAFELMMHSYPIGWQCDSGVLPHGY